MPDTRIFLGKVKGAVPEQFLLVEMYTDLSAIKRADFTTEARLRKTLRFNGMPDAEVNAGRGDQFKMNFTTLGTAWEDSFLQKRYVMGDAVVTVKHAIDSGRRNFIAHMKVRWRFARSVHQFWATPATW